MIRLIAAFILIVIALIVTATGSHPAVGVSTAVAAICLGLWALSDKEAAGLLN